MKITSFQDLFIHELKDLYSVEDQILEALPEMIRMASDDTLQEALQMHLEETKVQVRRLEEIADELEVDLSGHECKGMKGIIEEGKKSVQSVTEGSVRDATIISAAQRVEHYEIAGYGGAVAFASELGHSSIADLLQETLDEEGSADEKLSGIATGGLFSRGVNEMAMDEDKD